MIKKSGAAVLGTSLLGIDAFAAKEDATFCHKSQKPGDWYDWHIRMQEFRGMESNCKAAEGFIHLRRTGNDIL